MKAGDVGSITFPVERFRGGLSEEDSPGVPLPIAHGFSAMNLGNVPVRVSLVTTATEVADQGERGTCATFAMSSVAQCLLRHDLSEQHLYWIAWNAYAVAHPGHIAQGTSLEVVGAALTKGVCAESAWPYENGLDPANLTHHPPPPSVDVSPRYAIRSFAVEALAANAVERICELISGTKTPVVISTAIMKDAGWDQGFVIDVPARQEQTGSHAVVVVGYDIPSRILIIQNSWSPYWAVFGYAAMTFEYVQRYVRNVASLQAP